MSNWGTDEKGGALTSAWEYRSLFLRDGVKFDEFFCPFCDIRLAPYLIYSEGELSKSPHFSARWGDHVNGCDGEPTIVGAPERRSTEAHYEPREMHFPEALADRPTPRKQQPSVPGNPTTPPAPDEVTRRRRDAGALGRPVPKAYSLQPIVEAWSVVVKNGYDQEKEKNWSEGERKDWIKETLSAMPLSLDDTTTYEDAFRSPAYINRHHPRIYHGSGTIYFEQGTYVIESVRRGKMRDAELPFRVAVDCELLAESSPRSHATLIATLNRFIAKGQRMRWYAYGMPESANGALTVCIHSLDHLYVKRDFVPTPKSPPDASLAKNLRIG